MRYYFIKTFGCQMNIADSERIASILENFDCKKTDSEKNADIIVFNTCSVRQTAEDRIFGLNKILKRLKIKNSKLKIILTGCMMHYDLKELEKRLPLVDVFIDIKKIQELPKILRLRAGYYKPKANFRDYLSIGPRGFSKFTALVPISFGCNNFCTYCIVPFSRGREYSRPAQEILKEVKYAVRGGRKEIWLLGQNVNSYGIEEKTFWDNKNNKQENPKIKNGCMTFANLLREVNKIPGNFWIRFTSPHPKDFSEDLISALKECEKVTPYLNLPVQSGDNEILKKMNRGYTNKQYLKLVKRIRKQIPGITLSTDVIVGFPGETKAQFKNTAKIFKEVGFDMAYISKYSPRSKTVAATSFKDSVSRKDKENRRKNLNNILKKSALRRNKKYVNKVVSVLIDSYRDNAIFGKTESFKTVTVKNINSGVKKMIGTFIKARILKANDFGLEGKLIKS